MDSLKNMTYWDAVGLINKVKNVVMNYSEWEIKVRDGMNIYYFIIPYYTIKNLLI